MLSCRLPDVWARCGQTYLGRLLSGALPYGCCKTEAPSTEGEAGQLVGISPPPAAGDCYTRLPEELEIESPATSPPRLEATARLPSVMFIPAAHEVGWRRHKADEALPVADYSPPWVIKFYLHDASGVLPWRGGGGPPHHIKRKMLTAKRLGDEPVWSAPTLSEFDVISLEEMGGIRRPTGSGKLAIHVPPDLNIAFGTLTLTFDPATVGANLTVPLHARSTRPPHPQPSTHLHPAAARFPSPSSPPRLPSPGRLPTPARLDFPAPPSRPALPSLSTSAARPPEGLCPSSSARAARDPLPSALGPAEAGGAHTSRGTLPLARRSESFRRRLFKSRSSKQQQAKQQDCYTALEDEVGHPL